MDLLYLNDENGDLVNYYDEQTFKAFQALSPRPHFDEPADMERTLKDNAEEVWNLIQDPKTYVYVAGLSKLEEVLDKTIGEIAGSEEAWTLKKAELITNRRWATLFYS